MSAPRDLRMIYREIPPASPCVPGCSDCCGPVPWAPAERARIEADIPLSAHWVEIRGVMALENPATGKCPFASTDGCRVYERRPFVCRLFASTADTRLRCPHGCAATHPLTKRQSDALAARYHATYVQR